MTAISKENRAEWKALAQECAAENIACYPTTPEEFLDILDALEAAEARAVEAERQRNKLAEALAGLEAFPAEVYPQQLDYANSAIVDIWLEWAAQKEEYNV